MKITRIRLLGPKCFLTPAFEWPRMVSPHSTNGSGKTTLLEGIAAVRNYVGRTFNEKKDAPGRETALMEGKFPQHCPVSAR